MAKQAGQKLKLLYLIQIFEENTDENGHYLTLPQIQEKLKDMMRLDKEPDRKSLYDDLEVLRDDFGFDICDERIGAKTYYYLGSRDFDVAELRMIVDAIASSKFLTEKKTQELIRKIEKFCSPFERTKLNRQITLTNRVKSGNTSIHINVDAISNAITENRKITFRYFTYNIKKERAYKDSTYKVSPWALIYSEENYYLLALDGERFKHFRVDRMERIATVEEMREGEAEFKKKDMADYQKYTFNMFGGDIRFITLQLRNNLMNVVIDRFGRGIIPTCVDDDHFRITVPVAISPQFYGWVVGLGKDVKIVEPDDVRKNLQNYLDEIQKIYEHQ